MYETQVFRAAFEYDRAMFDLDSTLMSEVIAIQQPHDVVVTDKFYEFVFDDGSKRRLTRATTYIRGNSSFPVNFAARAIAKKDPSCRTDEYKECETADDVCRVFDTLRERGNDVHYAIETLVKTHNRLDSTVINSMYPCWKSHGVTSEIAQFLHWVMHTGGGYQLIGSEVLLADYDIGVAGTADLILYEPAKDRFVIVDFKTCRETKLRRNIAHTYKAQLELYAAMFKKMTRTSKKVRTCVLQLNRYNGSTMDEHEPVLEQFGRYSFLDVSFL